jgi:hypothetical protein
MSTELSTELSAPPLARATWRGARLWVVLAIVIGLGAIAVALLAGSSAVPLAPDSAAHDGSKALAQLLGQRGTSVQQLHDPGDALARPSTTTVLIVDPDDLGHDQLAQLAAGHRLVLIAPDITSLAAVTTTEQLDDVAPDGAVNPGCSWPGATATGPVTFPSGTFTYTGPGTCYGGAVVIGDRLVVLGSSSLLRNDTLAKNDIAALDLNAISNNGTVARVAWLMPGIEDTGSGRPSIWALFPPWAQRAFWWLLVVGVVVVLWRGRRFGPVVTEPLPVVVRSTEVVEGHGRLYLRTGARERAAGLLRAATTTRLAARLGLDRRAGPAEVAAALPAATALIGAAPADDDALVRLAHDLDQLTEGSVPTHD